MRHTHTHGHHWYSFFLLAPLPSSLIIVKSFICALRLINSSFAKLISRGKKLPAISWVSINQTNMIAKLSTTSGWRFSKFIIKFVPPIISFFCLQSSCRRIREDLIKVACRKVTQKCNWRVRESRRLHDTDQQRCPLLHAKLFTLESWKNCICIMCATHLSPLIYTRALSCARNFDVTRSTEARWNNSFLLALTIATIIPCKFNGWYQSRPLNCSSASRLRHRGIDVTKLNILCLSTWRFPFFQSLSNLKRY